MAGTVKEISLIKQVLQLKQRGESNCGIETGEIVKVEVFVGCMPYSDYIFVCCMLSIAYYYARNDYVMHRELATGKGFADIVLIPRKNVDSPAIVIELKVNKDADTAIDQIQRKQYPTKVQEYTDRLLLVGINYDRQTKQHTCRIEK